MPKNAHSEEQVVAVPRKGEAGEKVADICRRSARRPAWGRRIGSNGRNVTL